jgi:hypothetical protein
VPCPDRELLGLSIPLSAWARHHDKSRRGASRKNGDHAEARDGRICDRPLVRLRIQADLAGFLDTD